VYKKTGHNIMTQEEHPTHHSPCHIVFYKLQQGALI